VRNLPDHRNRRTAANLFARAAAPLIGAVLLHLLLPERAAAQQFHLPLDFGQGW
jgi:hypothetical protein